jgi:hypothetical protein
MQPSQPSKKRLNQVREVIRLKALLLTRQLYSRRFIAE